MTYKLLALKFEGVYGVYEEDNNNMSNAIQIEVENLVIKELNSANEKFPQFHSSHEGYAIIKEEIEECSDDLQDIREWQNAIWKLIKFNQGTEIQGEAAIKLKSFAINLACEAIQVAAMAQKFLDMGDKPNE